MKFINQYQKTLKNFNCYLSPALNKLINLKNGLANFRLRLVFIMVFAGFLPHFSISQTLSNEAEWTGSGYALKKIVSNTSIQSGVNFSYTIMFSAPAGATTINITDAIPASLVVVNVPAPAPVNGVSPTVTVTGVPEVNETVTYNLTGLPAGSASSGSFTIVVKFPEGTTCNGESARNRVCMLVNGEEVCTPFVSTTAIAADPWKINKSILSGAVVNPGGGACGYMIAPGDTVTYRLYVMKNSPYWGNVSGQINMSNPVVTDVLPTGAVLISSTCGAVQSGTTITWDISAGGTVILNAANPYEYFYCDIQVVYPSASFPVGTFIYNSATLTGDICGQQVSHTSNQTCVEVINYTPTLSANFQKYISLANRVPGCSGIYTLVFCNNGNTALSAFNINDAIPAGITVDKIVISGANSTSTVNLNINSSPYATGLTAYYNSGTLTTTPSNIQVQMTGTLPVGNCIYVWLYFTIDVGATGTIQNCASFDGLSNGFTLPNACVSFTIETGAPKPCLIKDICSPQSDYEPGDIIRFRIRVQNIGSADISGANFQDNLHSNFNYIGNETYYISSTYSPPCGTSGGIPGGTTPWTGVNTSHSGNNLTWVLPDIPADCQLFYSAYCGVYGTYGLPYYFIEFDVQVDSFALPGVTPNLYDISGGNIVSPVTSNTVNVLVVASFGQEVEKKVSTDGGSTFASSGTASPSSTAKYQLNYKNVSNVPVTSIKLADLLPRNDGSNDWLVLNRSANRGSMFDMSYVSTATHSSSLVPGAAISNPAISSTTTNNMCLPMFGLTGGCVAVSWGGPGGPNVLMDFSTQVVGPNITLREEFDVQVSPTATVGQTACNDFAAIATANFLLNGSPTSVALTPIASPPICIVVDSVTANCCDSVIIEQISDPTIGECCVRISTECEVKSIQVLVDNGTISSANWNCGNLPSGYQGQNNFTFGANNCALDMTNCFEPDSAGIIMVTYVINFANGEKCEKRIEINCGEIQENCCDSIEVRQVVGADGTPECCAVLTTKCEVDSVLVSVTNGTLSFNNWTCGTIIPAAAIGQNSYMFNTNNCVLTMKNCVDPDQTGLVTIQYTVFFSNGEKCEKSVQMDCVDENKHCCDSIDIRQTVNANGELGCCVELNTKCEVDSVVVSVVNGTLSSNSWSCASAIPAAAIGASSYTFDANGCVVNMTNCINPSVPGSVTVNYLVYFSNGEKCEKSIQMDCAMVDESCCDSIRVEKVQGDDGCCAKLITTCGVESVEVTVGNGVISSANWNCGFPIPSGYVGQSNFVFGANGCVVDMITCVSPKQSGVVTITYTVTFINGEKCEKTIELDCPQENDPCCAEVDLKLKPKWPFHTSMNGTFTINNLDPSVPICYVELSYSSAATMSVGALWIDGTPSSQVWNQTRIPATGNLSPAAVNDIKFIMNSSTFKGVVTVCVVKCDGTRCCFEFKWNSKPWIFTELPIEEHLPVGKLVGISISPKLNETNYAEIKYVSFGLTEENEIINNDTQFFAVSAATSEGEDSPDGLASTTAAYMGRYSAFFELGVPVPVNAGLGKFNLVFANGLPKLGCTLFDAEGEVVASGSIEVSEIDTVATSAIAIDGSQQGLFDFVKLYPNPANGTFNVTFTTGKTRDVEIHLVNSLGQLVKTIQQYNVLPGVHTTKIEAGDLPAGLYRTILISEEKILSKSAVLK